MAFDLTGTLHIAYIDPEHRSLMYVTRDHDDHWSTPLKVDTVSDVGQSISIAIDPNRKAGIAYYDGINLNLKYAHNDSNGWSSSVVENQRRTGYYASLGYRTSGQPLIGYYVKSTGDIRLARGTKSGWLKQTVDSLLDVGRGLKLLVSQTAATWTIVAPRTDGTLVALNNSSGTIEKQIIDYSAKGFAYLSLASGLNDDIAVSYFDSTSKDLRYADTQAGEPWKIDTITTDGNVGQYSKLAFSLDGQAQVLSLDKTHGRILLSTQKDGGWDTTPVANATGNVLIAAKYHTDPFTFTNNDPSNSGTLETLPSAPHVEIEAEPGEIVISWTYDGTPVTGYVVQRSTDGTHYTTLAEVDSTTLSYDDAVDEAQRYYYRVLSRNQVGLSAPSNIQEIISPPAAPGQFAANAISDTQINLSWINQASVEHQIAIYRGSGDMDESEYQQIAVIAAGSTQYSDVGLEESSHYFYYIQAIANNVHSLDYTIADAITYAKNPLDLIATSLAKNQIQLEWTDISNSEGHYKVQRSEDGITFEDLVELPANSTSYTDVDLIENTEYSYRVLAASEIGTSSAALAASVTTRPSSPVNLVATGTNTAQIQLTWTNSSHLPVSFALQRADVDGEYSNLATIDSGQISYIDSDLVEGTTYNYRIRALGAGGYSEYSSPAQALTLSNAPSDLQTNSISSEQINLSWSDNSHSESGFVISQSLDGISYNDIYHLPTNSTSFSNTSLTEGRQYFYKVRTFNPGGDSEYSDVKSEFTRPATPNALVATSISSGHIRITWSDNSLGETQYIISRSADGQIFSDLSIQSAGTTEYHDSGLDEATQYFYRVRASNDGGESVFSNTDTTLTRPLSPSSLTVTPASDHSIALEWNDNSHGESGYVIQRSTDGISFSNLGLIDANSTSYVDLTASESSSYFYRVRATNSVGTSEPTISATVKTFPAAPTNLVATTVSDNSIILHWSDNSSGENAYIIERSTNNLSFTQIGTAAASSTSYADSGLQNSTQYFYRVYATNSSGHSNRSNHASSTTAPAIPGNLAVNALNKSQIDIAWTASSGNEAGFIIERSEDGEKFYQLTALYTSGSENYSYTDSDLSASTRYYYRICAFNSAASSSFTETLSATTNEVPTLQPPLKVAGESPSAYQINLSWWNENELSDSAIIERSTDGKDFNEIAQVVQTQPVKVSYVDTGLDANTTYYYRILTTYRDQRSEFTEVLQVETFDNTSDKAPPQIPTKFAWENISATALRLSWFEESDSTKGFIIERSLDGKVFLYLTAFNSDGGGEHEFLDDQLPEKTNAYYRIRAYNTVGTSELSDSLDTGTR